MMEFYNICGASFLFITYYLFYLQNVSGYEITLKEPELYPNNGKLLQTRKIIQVRKEHHKILVIINQVIGYFIKKINK